MTLTFQKFQLWHRFGVILRKRYVCFSDDVNIPFNDRHRIRYIPICILRSLTDLCVRNISPSRRLVSSGVYFNKMGM